MSNLNAVLPLCQRIHTMPYGANVLPDGSVCFRLYAPTAQRVELILPDTEPITMDAQGDGFYETTQTRLTPDQTYQYRINGNLVVPDPASRYQPQDVHGPSQIIDPAKFNWQDTDWKGRPWLETVLYELHVGSFTPQGTFAAIKERLDDLVDLGITAIELMPLSDFPGGRNWGYDGVLPYAPDSAYGSPDDLKDLIQTAHQKGLMVFLDVVYNHFGPEGNYIGAYASDFFTDRYPTPWGAALNFEGVKSHNKTAIRQFFIHNALYWLEEYHIDGLRFDAVHAIQDHSTPDILEELAQTVQTTIGKDRHIHLVLENDANQAKYLSRQDETPRYYTAQWNDDIHHILHVLVSGESSGYYADYATQPADHLGRSLTQGFDYQGQASPYRDGEMRGEPSNHLPPQAFVAFLQNHDQIGNRAYGDRITAFSNEASVTVALAVYLLSPQIPLLFMGEEWASSSPFPFFCDFGPELAQKVTEGRRKEFARFPEFSDPASQAKIPDPEAETSFLKARLDWSKRENSEHSSWLALYTKLLHLRRDRMNAYWQTLDRRQAPTYTVLSDKGLFVQWPLQKGITVTLLANFDTKPLSCPIQKGNCLFSTASDTFEKLQAGTLPAQSAIWLVE